MTGAIFRQAIAISFLGHATLFGIFSLSFGPSLPRADFNSIYFRGAAFRGCDLLPAGNAAGHDKALPLGRAEISVLNKGMQEDGLLIYREHNKPLVVFSLKEEKAVFMPKTAQASSVAARKETAIMFYPRLPYHFALYFKDRQDAHIELEFQVRPADKRSSVLVKRKISSGNLEADLLSMRYINRYLFMQKGGFVPGKWQTVKIDLSTLND